MLSRLIFLGQIISYTSKIKRKSYQERSDLANQIQEIHWQYAQMKSPHLYKHLELKTKFDLLITHSIEQSLLKSKSMFYIYGEKSDKLLANQLKGFKAKQTISKIQLTNGHLTMDHLQINEAFSDFDTHLYTSEFQADCHEIYKFLNDVNIPSLSPDLKKKLEEPISQAEIALAISIMQSGKCPGPDGFLAEFLKKFSLLLAPLLCSFLSESHIQGFLPLSFTKLASLLKLKKVKTQLIALPIGLSPS